MKITRAPPKEREAGNGEYSPHTDSRTKTRKTSMYKVLGYSDNTEYYRTRGKRQKIGIYCTKVQRIEIELEFEFYRNVFYEELGTFMNAFIQAQKIFPEDAPQSNKELWEFSEDEIRTLQMAEGIKKRTRAEMIEDRKGEHEEET